MLIRTLRKMLSGRSYVKCVQIVPTHVYNEKHPLHGMIEVHFHRKGGWSIFGYKDYPSHSYVRPNVDNIVNKLQRCKDVKFSTVSVSKADWWFLQWYGMSHNERIYASFVRFYQWVVGVSIWLYVILKWMGY